MAPKKSNPMEEPPAVSYEDEEEEETTEEEETSSGDEETPEPTQISSPPLKQLAAKKPAARPVTPAKSSSSEEETGSESESKPIARKPMEETPAKARSYKPASKRANETEGTQKDAKRAKEKEAEEEAGEETKKQLFQRLWSEDDEIAVLKGMLEYSTKKGVDPYQDMNGFHDFIKKSLHIDASRAQLMDKIRRLKNKYVNNLKRGIKKGEEVNLSKPHEQKAYELSKKVWVDSAVKSNGKAKKVQTHVEEMEVDNEKESSLKVVDVGKFLLDRSLEDFVIGNGLNMVGASKKMELDKRWKKLQIAQLELYVERTNLIEEQAMLMLDALKTSNVE